MVWGTFNGTGHNEVVAFVNDKYMGFERNHKLIARVKRDDVTGVKVPHSFSENANFSAHRTVKNGVSRQLKVCLDQSINLTL